MQLGYFQVMAEPVSTWVQEIFESAPRQAPRRARRFIVLQLVRLGPNREMCIRVVFSALYLAFPGLALDFLSLPLKIPSQVV